MVNLTFTIYDTSSIHKGKGSTSLVMLTRSQQFLYFKVSRCFFLGGGGFHSFVDAVAGIISPDPTIWCYCISNCYLIITNPVATLTASHSHDLFCLASTSNHLQTPYVWVLDYRNRNQCARGGGTEWVVQTACCAFAFLSLSAQVIPFPHWGCAVPTAGGPCSAPVSLSPPRCVVTVCWQTIQCLHPPSTTSLHSFLSSSGFLFPCIPPLSTNIVLSCKSHHLLWLLCVINLPDVKKCQLKQGILKKKSCFTWQQQKHVATRQFHSADACLNRIQRTSSSFCLGSSPFNSFSKTTVLHLKLNHHFLCLSVCVCRLVAHVSVCVCVCWFEGFVWEEVSISLVGGYHLLKWYTLSSQFRHRLKQCCGECNTDRWPE